MKETLSIVFTIIVALLPIAIVLAIEASIERKPPMPVDRPKPVYPHAVLTQERHEEIRHEMEQRRPFLID